MPRRPSSIVFAVTALATDLLRRQAYVDGRWVDADSGATFPVLNPATGETIAEVPRLGAAETRRALEAAQRALPGWKSRTAKDRSKVLRRLAGLMSERSEELATLMVTEQGKPLAEARVEVEYALSFYEWFAEEAKRLDGRLVPTPWPEKRILVTGEAIGVTAGITPWNFPAAMPTRKSAPALAVGCTMVLKPAEQTPLCALAVAALAEEAGIPPGVFSVVTGDAEDAPEIGRELTSNPIVRKVGFTGSTEVGKILMGQCAGQVKKISLELGGNAPFIVFDDGRPRPPRLSRAAVLTTVPGRPHLRSFPIPDSGAARRRRDFGTSGAAHPATCSATYRLADRRRQVDSARVPLAAMCRRASPHGSERGHSPRRAGLGRVDLGGVGALRRPRGVRIQPWRIHRGRSRRPPAPASGGRDRTVRIVPGRPFPARAVSAGHRASRSGRPRHLGRRCSAGRSHRRLHRRVRGRCLLDAVPAGSHGAASITGETAKRADRCQRRDSTIESLGTLLGPLGAGVLVAFADAA